MKEYLGDKILIDDREPEAYTGVGGEKLSKGVEKLPAVEVKNKVVWVNENMKLPFDIEKGESNRLGMFLTPEPLSDVSDPYQLEMRTGHRRSGILGRVIFEDKEGRLYRDVDLKGVGFTGRIWLYENENKIVVQEPEIDTMDSNYPGGSKTLGVLDRPYAENDIKMAEKFLKAGIRTYRPIALIRLQEIIDKNGDKISMGMAKSRGLVKRKDEPVVEVRAFGTRARTEDLQYADRDILIKDARSLVAQEIGKNPDDFSSKDYLGWFIETMAVSLARMHSKNWIHGYLTPHNITLDGRIIDLDSVETAREVGKRKKAGENSHKSFENDVNSVVAVMSYLKKKLGFKLVEPYEGYDLDFDEFDRIIEEMFSKIYNREVEKLKKARDDSGT